MELIRAATLTVSNLKQSQALYCEWLGYTCVEKGTVSQELAESWGAPKTFNCDYCILQPASNASVFIRLIEQPTVSQYRALRSYGWAAIEICVEDTLSVYESVKNSPFEIIGLPKELDGMPEIFPMQVKGPDQEIIYLTQIRADLKVYNLPRAQSPIDKLFVLVMAASNIEKTNNWIEKHLRVDKGPSIAIIYSMINKAFKLPNTSKHPITVFKHKEDAFLEIDQYPKDAINRPHHEEMLPPCVAIGSFIHPEFDKLITDNENLWITPPTKQAGMIYKNKRAGTIRTPDGTLIEIIEA